MIMNCYLEMDDWNMCWPWCDPWRGEKALHFSNRFSISTRWATKYHRLFFLSLGWLFDILNDQHLKSLFLRNGRLHPFAAFTGDHANLASCLLFCLLMMLKQVFTWLWLCPALRDAVGIKLAFNNKCLRLIIKATRPDFSMFVIDVHSAIKIVL